MPSDDEIKFARSRFKIQDAICTCFATAELLLPITLRESGGRVESIVGDMQPDTLAGQQLLQFRTYVSVGLSRPERIEALIGYTGDAWTPIVTVSSSSTEPQQVLFDPDVSSGLPELLKAITTRIKLLL